MVFSQEGWTLFFQWYWRVSFRIRIYKTVLSDKDWSRRNWMVLPGLDWFRRIWIGFSGVGFVVFHRIGSVVQVRHFRFSSGALHILVHAAEYNVTGKEGILLIIFYRLNFNYLSLLYWRISRSREDIFATTSWYKWFLLALILSSRGIASLASPRPSQLMAR